MGSRNLLLEFGDSISRERLKVLSTHRRCQTFNVQHKLRSSELQSLTTYPLANMSATFNYLQVWAISLRYKSSSQSRNVC